MHHADVNISHSWGRDRLGPWPRRLFLATLMLSGAFALLGSAYQALSDTLEARKYPPPGQRVDVNGFKMHIQCMGSGGPTVILESALGVPATSWALVQPQIAQFTRVCSYDRAGYGWSDPSPAPRTSRHIAQELHTLLHNARIPGPYILVAHSFGGFTARLFADQYRDEVSGMVLVDSSQEDQNMDLPRSLRPPRMTELRNKLEWSLRPLAARVGLTRLEDKADNYAQFPPTLRPLVQALSLKTSAQVAMAEEMQRFDESAAQVRATRSLGDLPLVVLTANDIPPSFPADAARVLRRYTYSLHEKLAHLSSQSQHILVHHSEHMIQLNRPDVVIKAVKDVFDQTHQAGNSPAP